MNWEEKSKVTQNKNRLRGKRIVIDHDLSRNEREIQKKTLGKAREAREEGREVRIGVNRIRIDGTWYEWRERRKEKGMNKQNF